MAGPGARLGAYELLSKLGEGGMGEVYRARDTKLGRDVAVKVLPESFSRDADRLARFEREAKTLALLNHPHIAQVYGLEESGSDVGLQRALIMEFVDGDGLDARIARALSRWMRRSRSRARLPRRSKRPTPAASSIGI